ncbi:hypothetical protein BGX26_012375, partial [Mortierella sp. AD094]
MRIEDMPENHDYSWDNGNYSGEYDRKLDGNAPKEIEPGMTIDYSKFIPMIPHFKTDSLRVHSMMQLCKLPKQVRGGYGRVEEHSIDHQLDEDYLKELRDAFSKLWRHYNRDCTLSFTLDTTNTQKFLSFSKEMPKLQTLCQNDSLENTVLFIRQNQEAFPKKLPLHIQFGLDGKWDKPRESYSSIGNNNLKATLAKIKSLRDELFQYMKPIITIHEAVGEPSSFNISNIPYFYELANGIKLNRLSILIDFDENRIDQGEGLAMEAFLRRCPVIKGLHIGAGSPDILSWAANEALNTGGL